MLSADGRKGGVELKKCETICFVCGKIEKQKTEVKEVLCSADCRRSYSEFINILCFRRLPRSLSNSHINDIVHINLERLINKF